MTQYFKTVKDLSRIILLFNDAQTAELGVAEVAKRLGMVPSKISRMFKTLEDEVFFEKNPDTGKYRLGSRFLELGLTYAFHLPLRRIIRPHIEYLARELKTTSSWGYISRDKVVVLDRIQIIGLDTLSYRMSANFPIYSTSIGKVMLAFLSNGDVQRILESVPLVKFTPKTVTDLASIKENLATIKEQGFACDDCETAENIVCLATPVRDHSGKVIAAINLTDIVSNTSLEKLLGYVPLLKDRALFISRQLGYEQY